MSARKAYPSRVNWDYFRTVLNPALIPSVHEWTKKYPNEFYGKGSEFTAIYIADEKRFVALREPKQPEHMKGMHSCIQFHVEPSRASGKFLYDLSLPTVLLTDMAKPRFSLYRVDFYRGIDHVAALDETFSAFTSGYVGITKRSPIQRFREHMRDVVTGKGYLFHSSWRALLKAVPGVVPSFKIMERADTLDAIYDLEEYYVDKYTLAPKGLNAIPGGKAGFKFLGLSVKKGNLPNPDERDRICEKFTISSERKCTHYRIGHVRNLPSGKKTWISPCWVNMAEAV